MLRKRAVMATPEVYKYEMNYAKTWNKGTRTGDERRNYVQMRI